MGVLAGAFDAGNTLHAVEIIAAIVEYFVVNCKVSNCPLRRQRSQRLPRFDAKCLRNREANNVGFRPRDEA